MTLRSYPHDDQASALVALVRERQALIKSTARADRATCEDGLTELYRWCNRPKPEFYWSDFPTQALMQAVTQKRDNTLLDFRQMTIELGLERRSLSRVTVETSLPRRSYPSPFGVSEDLIDTYAELRAMNSMASHQALSWAAGSVVPARPRQGFVTNLTQSVQRNLHETFQFPGSNGNAPVPAWAAITHSAEEIIHFTPMELIDRLRGVDITNSAHAVVNAIIHNCGHFQLREQACYLIERPAVLRFSSENGDLHAECEPAIRYANGLTYFFFWHGIPVPESVGLVPAEAITPDYIRAHSTWLERNILIARMGIENFLSQSDAKITHEDETGKLWKARFRRGNSYSWSVIEVVNGTPEPDGNFKHYFLQVPPNLRRAREAVAWTYGLAETDYNVAVRT